jgi:hypothetical protein
MDSRRKFGLDKNGNPKYGREAVTKIQNIDKIKHWARHKGGCSFGFGLWDWPLEASHYNCSSQEAVGVHGQGFGLWA